MRATPSTRPHTAGAHRCAGAQRPHPALAENCGPSRETRARGCRHPHAARILARAWTRMLWRCRHDQIHYTPARHSQLTALTSDLPGTLAAA
jgi:hypothetical protein